MELISLQRDQLTLSAYVAGEGPLVVLLHGFPDTHRSWQQQCAALVEAGYRCLMPVMRGYDRGSARSDISFYAIESIAADVIAWLDHLNCRKAHVVGHDWGAVTAYIVAATYADRVQSLSTLAIPHGSAMRAGIRKHPIQILNSSYMLLFQWRGFAEWVAARKDYAFIRFLWRRWSPNLHNSSAAVDEVIDALQQPQVLTATLNYYRAYFSRRYRPQASVFTGALSVPTQMIAGGTDGCMNIGLYDWIEPSAFACEWRIERLPHAGHFMQLEAPEAVNQLLLEWIQAHAE